MARELKIAVAKNPVGWHDRFLAALEQKQQAGLPLTCRLVDMEQHNWLDQVEGCDLLLWKPEYMGTRAGAQFRAKVVYLEMHTRTRVIPNFKTIWHFENKIAQSYVFRGLDVPTPQTIVSFDYYDAIDLARREQYPLVFKEPNGAGSQNVRLVKSFAEARRIITSIFSQQLWYETKMRVGSEGRLILDGVFSQWFWCKIIRKLRGDENFRQVYWQRFVPGNERDLRITVFGDRNAVAFWRHNRPDDFRASGSGLIEYDRAVPEEPVRYCMDLTRALGVDTMAYDLLFHEGHFVISEMCFGYLDTPVYNAPGHFTMQPNGELQYRPGHTWPQEFWVDWALRQSDRPEFQEVVCY